MLTDKKTEAAHLDTPTEHTRPQVFFSGFSPQGPEFFRLLAENNNKEWFAEHRLEFERVLLKPFKALAEDLAFFMPELDLSLMLDPSKLVSRINRDTRFSGDKSPYKTNLWLSFRRFSKDWQFHPCWFFEMAADWYRYGMGYYSAPRAVMSALRRELVLRPARFRKIVEPIAEKGIFVVEGEQYKRVMEPEIPEDLRIWGQRKNLYVVRNCKPDQLLFSCRLAEEIKDGFKTLAPLYDFLWELEQIEKYGILTLKM